MGRAQTAQNAELLALFKATILQESDDVHGVIANLLLGTRIGRKGVFQM